MSTPHSPRFIQLMAAKDDILGCWSRKVRGEIPYACHMPMPALINTLPAFYDFLAAKTAGDEDAFDYSSIATEHGSQRARVTRFNAGSIVHEFQLFRSTIFDSWHHAGIRLELDEVARLNTVIDGALRESLTGFSLSEAQIREQFFSALTHDLRTPLSTASTAIQIIRKTNDLARVHRFADIAMRHHATLDAMIGSLLDMMVGGSEPALPELADTELHGLLADAIEGIALSSGRRITLQGEAVRGTWSAAALRRAFENLLNNAVKYSDADTTILVSVHAVGGHAIVSVTNTGPPIPAEQTEAIFQLFRRSKRDEDRGITGWGIGLPYVRSVAEQHGGSIAVESNEATTTFLFDVPLQPLPVVHH